MLSPVELDGTYFYVTGYRIATLVSQSDTAAKKNIEKFYKQKREDRSTFWYPHSPKVSVHDM